MARLPIACAIAATLCGCASIAVPYRACQSNAHQPHRSRAVVDVPLRERPSEPGYYFISGHYVVLITQDDALGAARAAAEGADFGPNVRFLQALERRPIGGQPIDLMIYTFDDWRLWDRPLYLAASLLEKGAAAVIDLQDSSGSDVAPRTLKRISVVALTGGGKWREFCGQGGEAILTTTDEIYD